MKFICDVCNWDYGRTLGYPVGGISDGSKTELPSEAAGRNSKEAFPKN